MYLMPDIFVPYTIIDDGPNIINNMNAEYAKETNK